MDTCRKWMNHEATREVIEWWKSCDSERKFKIKLIFPSLVGKLNYLCDSYEGPTFCYQINFHVFLDKDHVHHIKLIAFSMEEVRDATNKIWENVHRLNMTHGKEVDVKYPLYEAIWFEPVECTISEN